MTLRKIQDKSKESEYFDEVVEDDSMQGYDYMSDDVYKKIDSLLRPKSRVLELACGFGIHGKRLTETGHSVVGIDISPKMVEIANKEKKYGFKAVVGDIEDKMAFKANSFDVVLCAGILHHFPKRNFRRLRKNIEFWLKKRGILIIIEPNGSNIINKLSKAIGRSILFINPKTNICTKNEQDNYSYSIYKDYFSRYFDLVCSSSFSPGQRVRNKSILGIFTAIRWYLFKLSNLFPFPVKGEYLFLSFRRGS